ncbi:MAG: hypothetical protein M3R69_12265 [Acidobacteriota bacterium]|nr:hypothetical protein [Acidobacteriota bacterium]
MATSLSEDNIFFLGKIKKGLAAQGSSLESDLESFLKRPLDRDTLFAVALGGETQAHIKFFAQALEEAFTRDGAGKDKIRAVRDWRTRTDAVRGNSKSHIISLVVMHWYRDGGQEQLEAAGGGSRRSYWAYLLVLALAAALAVWFVFKFLGR